MKRLIEPHYRTRSDEVIFRTTITPAADLNFHSCLQFLGEQLKISHLRRGGQQYPVICELDQEQQGFDLVLPDSLFESGNLIQQLSIILDQFLHTGAISDIMIRDIEWSQTLLEGFKGPNNGLEGLRNHSGIHDRALSSVLITPYAGLSNKDLIERAYHCWMGGIDIVMESPLMASSQNSEFYERIEYLAREQESCHRRSKSPKYFIPHISAPSLEECLHRAKKSKEVGLSFVSVNGQHLDPMSLSSLRNSCKELHLGLCVQQGLSRTIHPTLSPQLQALLKRLLGADIIGFSIDSEEDSIAVVTALQEEHTRRSRQQLRSIPMICQLSGADTAQLIKSFGKDLILQGDHSICDHPDGIKAGAEAFHNTIVAASQGVSLPGMSFA